MKPTIAQVKRICPMSLMDWYLIQELGGFFLVSFALFTTSGVAIGTVADLMFKIREYQLPPTVALQILGCKIPEYAGYCLPIALLLTGLVVYGRKQEQLELVALQSFGVDQPRLILPMLLLSLLIALITLGLNELIVPVANYQANLLQQHFLPAVAEPIFFAEYTPQDAKAKSKVIQNLYWAETYLAPKLLGVSIVKFQQGGIVQLVTAQAAQWDQTQQLWQFTSGSNYQLASTPVAKSPAQWSIKHLALPPTLFEIAQLRRNPQEMSLAQVKRYLKLVQGQSSPGDIARLQVQIHQKYAFPYICVVFALVGSVLGVRYSQLHRGRSFGICVLIVFGYYVLGFILGSLGITQIIPPWWAAWLPNLIGLGCGGYLLFFAPA